MTWCIGEVTPRQRTHHSHHQKSVASWFKKTPPHFYGGVFFWGLALPYGAMLSPSGKKTHMPSPMRILSSSAIAR